MIGELYSLVDNRHFFFLVPAEMLLRWSVLDFVPFVQSHEGCLADGDVVFLLDLAYSGVNGLIAPLVQHFPRD